MSIRSFVRMLSGPPEFSAARHQRRARACLTTLRAFYLANVGFATLWWLLWRHEVERAAANPVWILAWADGMDLRPLLSIAVVGLFASAAAAFVLPGSRTVRVAVAATLLVIVAVMASAGPNRAGLGAGPAAPISHTSHAWLWTAVLLAALPAAIDLRRRTDRHDLIEGMAFVQFTVALFYGFAGASKVAFAVKQWLAGEVTAASPEALSRHVADKLVISGISMPWTDSFVHSSLLGAAAWYGMLALELGSPVAALRPSWHRGWGLAILGFHTASGLTMDVWFKPAWLVVGLLFVASPLAPRQRRLK